jgi:membrane associated rhomboid family serine protease
MIPIRDDVPSKTVPWVNLSFIGVNVFIFLLELGMGPGLQRFLRHAAVIPAAFSGGDRILTPGDVVATAVDPTFELRILLSMFLHGGFAHILGNMLYLWVFGDGVEDRMGHMRYLVFYLLCGWIAAYAHIWSDPASRLPSIGASGAIAGVLGAYVALYPRARVVTLLPLGLFWPLVQVPAVFFLGLWFLQQFVLGTLSLAGPDQSGGTAWWAHIGGFLAGIGLVSLFQNPRRRPPVRRGLWDDRRLRGY